MLFEYNILRVHLEIHAYKGPLVVILQEYIVHFLFMNNDLLSKWSYFFDLKTLLVEGRSQRRGEHEQ